MKVNVYSMEGEVKEEMELPAIFNEEYRPDLIKRAVISSQTARVQPWGNDPMAGKRTSAKGWGSGRGTARVPRIKNGSRAAFVPMAIGGRQAHPTRAEKNHHEKINIKERRFAIRSAVAATTNKELVEKRGHVTGDIKQLPIIVDDEISSVKTTKQTREIFQNLGVYDDIERVTNTNNYDNLNESDLEIIKYSFIIKQLKDIKSVKKGKSKIIFPDFIQDSLAKVPESRIKKLIKSLPRIR